MNKIGIIFAMSEELEKLLKFLKLEKEYEIFELKFYEGKIYNKNIILVESGVGKVNAARTCQILIDNMKVDYIFNIGVAGGIDDSLNILDIVIAESLVQHDFDITAFNHEKGYIPKIGKFIECDEYLLRIANSIKYFDQNINIHSGVIASGDIFLTDENMGLKINKKFNALCSEMEGASIAHVCKLDNIPFLVLRSISDTLNKNNNVLTYEEFLDKSSENMALFMLKILEKMDNL